jgi:phosphatidylserine/phosphatidylglycerophosphate/cardiolipin synthase-like enzyme
MARRLRILTRSILGEFARVVHVNGDRIYRLWLISPWICGQGERADPVYPLIESLRKRPCDVFVITRPPTALWHDEAVRLLKSHAQATVYYCDDLHTKLYIAECNGFRGAVLGSPNLTSRANARNRELAIELRTTVSTDDDDVASLINDLTRYASSLRAESYLSMA